MKNWPYIAGAYLSTAGIIGAYLASLLRKKRALEGDRRGRTR